MSYQCATTTFTRNVTVAAGDLAPGHLGELTRHAPFELVDAVIAETNTAGRRRRHLPSRVGMYFLLALALFPGLGYLHVWEKLCAGLSALHPYQPSEKALRDLRRRLGAAPLKTLFEALAGFLAQPSTPGTHYRRWRTVAFDGCSSIRAADRPRILERLRKTRHRWGEAGYPTLQLLTLVETGTRGLLGAAFGSTSAGELAYATRLLPLLSPAMLLLVDRGFDSADFFTDIAATGAHLLARLRSERRPAVLAVLPDGSYLTRLGTLKVRIIEGNITVTTSDGQCLTESYRLATTLLDHRADPADAMIRLYHERWEIESAYYALRHTLMTGCVLRSQDLLGWNRNCGPCWPHISSFVGRWLRPSSRPPAWIRTEAASPWHSKPLALSSSWPTAYWTIARPSSAARCSARSSRHVGPASAPAR
ncbi:IS4 family transposase [Kitasatospora sp. NPDC050463]|uniref:IS4 family transposase n=1 Tax=Kitasatospora sp. NPDC050463 TaxID=3155786 RepID=UPI0033CCC876